MLNLKTTLYALTLLSLGSAAQAGNLISLDASITACSYDDGMRRHDLIGGFGSYSLPEETAKFEVLLGHGTAYSSLTNQSWGEDLIAKTARCKSVLSLARSKGREVLLDTVTGELSIGKVAAIKPPAPNFFNDVLLNPEASEQKPKACPVGTLLLRHGQCSFCSNNGSTYSIYIDGAEQFRDGVYQLPTINLNRMRKYFDYYVQQGYCENQDATGSGANSQSSRLEQNEETSSEVPAV